MRLALSNAGDPMPSRTIALFLFALAAAEAGPAAADTYVVAFNQQSLPANVDKLVADAGGTIVLSVPQIGGIAVESSNPNFLSAISAVSGVHSADFATQTSLAPTWSTADNGV